MQTFAVFIISLTVFIVTHASAQQLPVLVAKIYPGAVMAGSRCADGEAQHTPYCFVTKDSIDKVREFYAREGVKLGTIPVKEDQNAAGDDLYDLEMAVGLQLGREEIGSIYAAPVEYWESKSEDDEPSYFNSVIVMSGKAKGKLQGSAQANKAAIIGDHIFNTFALTPESAQFMIPGGLLVDPDLLIPLYNKHVALQGAYFKEGDASAWMQINLTNLNKKRMTERFNKGDAERQEKRAVKPEKMTLEMRMNRIAERAAERERKAAERKQGAGKKVTSDNPEDSESPEDKTKVIDAFLDQMEKEAYPTLIMIQMSGNRDVKKDPAIVQKEWRSAF